MDIAPWFSSQWHKTKPCIQTVQELKGQLYSSERVSSVGETDPQKQKNSAFRDSSHKLIVDAVIISHEFSDHCHRETLLDLDPATPIFATKKAVPLIKSWKYFTTVSEIPAFIPLDPDWEKYSIRPFPDWLGVSRIVSKSDFVKLHSAILLTFRLDHKTATSDGQKSVEALIYSPHGIAAQELRQVHSTSPSINVLALLHGLNSVTLSPFWQLNLGAQNGLLAQRTSKAKYWITTHDEDKRGAGLVAPLIKRKVLTLRETIKQQQREEEADKHDPGKQQNGWSLGENSANATQVVISELGSGESILLL